MRKKKVLRAFRAPRQAGAPGGAKGSGRCCPGTSLGRLSGVGRFSAKFVGFQGLGFRVLGFRVRS